MPHPIVDEVPPSPGGLAHGWGHVQAFKVDDQSAEVCCASAQEARHQPQLSASCACALVVLTAFICPGQEMLKMLQLATPNGSPEVTPRQNHGQEGGSNTQSTVHSSASLRTAAEMHSGSSDDSSDSDDESFVSSQHAIKARSVRSAQKGGPVTSMSSRGSRPNAPSFSSLPANGDTPVPSLLIEYEQTSKSSPRHACVLLSRWRGVFEPRKGGPTLLHHKRRMMREPRRVAPTSPRRTMAPSSLFVTMGLSPPNTPTFARKPGTPQQLQLTLANTSWQEALLHKLEDIKMDQSLANDTLMSAPSPLPRSCCASAKCTHTCRHANTCPMLLAVNLTKIVV